MVVFTQIASWTGMAFDSYILLGVAWSVLIWLGPYIFVPLSFVVIIYAHWPKIKTQLVGRPQPPFFARPMSGETLLLAMYPEKLAEARVTARLAIKNTSGKPLHACTLRLVDAFLLHAGQVLEYCQPSISSAKGESFLLRWADSESPSEDGKYLDMPPDDAERIAEVLILDVPSRIALFAAANRADLKNRLPGILAGSWFKLRIKISASDGTFVDTEWCAACGDRDPGPIMFDYWHRPGELKGRGEAILESQRKRDQATSSA